MLHFKTICKNLWLLLLLVFISIPAHASVPEVDKIQSKNASQAKAIKSFAKVPLHFESNQGQTNNEVKFFSRGPGYGLFLTQDEAVLSFKAGSEETSSSVRMQLVGANPKPKVIGEDKLASISNYFIGNDSSQWHSNIANYGKVRYQEVYPGIDLVYYGNQQHLEYDFIVQPGADPKNIRLSYEGIDGYHIEGGDLVLESKSGEEVIFKAPVMYQEIGGKRENVDGNFIFLDGQQVSFYIRDYDKNQPLIIDPVLAFSTYLGGSETDLGMDVAVDNNGDVYITGQTESLFPTSTGSFDTSFNGNWDAFVSKLSSDGSTLIYSTYIGGDANDRSYGIAVDSGGNAYITGEIQGPATVDYPTTAGAFDSTRDGSWVAFVTKLSPDGSSLVYSTVIEPTNPFHLSTGQASGGDIVVNASGNAFITGRSTSSSFPLTPGAFFSSNSPGGNNIIIVKLSADGSSLVWSSFFGDYSGITGQAIALDSAENVYVTGATQSNSLNLSGPPFPTTPGAYDTSHNGSNDVFVSKISADGSTLVYSTFIGGDGTDFALDIAVDSSGNAYVTGYTQGNSTSLEFPTTVGAFNTTSNGGRDVIVSKISADGSTLLFSTYLGGDNFDRGAGIALDSNENVYISGSTFGGSSIVFPTTPDAIDSSHSGGSNNDAFVSKLSADGSTLLFSTFLGGDGNDLARRIALDSNGNIFIAGVTDGGTDEVFPSTVGAFDTAHNGVRDAFIAKIGGFGPTVTADAGPDQTVDEGESVVLDGTASSHSQGEPLNYDWSQVAGPAVTLDLTDPAQPVFTAPYVSSNQTLTFELIVDDGTNFSDPDSVDITVVNVNTPPIADAGDDGTVKEAAIATLDGSNSFDNEGDPITYQWTQVSGPAVSLQPNDTVSNPTFTAPLGIGSVLEFELVVSDGKEPSSPDKVFVTIVENSPPIADAGPDQTKDEGNPVTLDGTASSDPDGGDVLSFSWSQTGGPSVTLSDVSVATPSFDAPAVAAGGDTLSFELTVTDNDPVNPKSDVDTVDIHVLNANDPPSCDLAVANPDKLWPPNHKMVQVEIDGVMDSDAEYGDVTLEITGVTQDEPVNGLGDGDSSPDAVVQVSAPSDSVLIRSERSGNENGRVYQVNFTADDGFESCTGSVNVSVPHSRKSTAVDDGQTVDSTLP